MKKIMMLVFSLSVAHLIKASAQGLPGYEFSPSQTGSPDLFQGSMSGPAFYQPFVPGVSFHPNPFPCPVGYSYQDPRDGEIHRLNMCLQEVEKELTAANAEVRRLSGLLGASQRKVAELRSENTHLKDTSHVLPLAAAIWGSSVGAGSLVGSQVHHMKMASDNDERTGSGDAAALLSGFTPKDHEGASAEH